MKDLKVKGPVCFIIDANLKAIDNIDTDMIFHNSHLHITEVAEMGQHAFGNLDGFKDFPKTCKKGDILFTGKNFGAGSSRQQAVDCFAALGVSVIIAESFGAIYKRNAINSGMPIIEAPDFFAGNHDLNKIKELEVDFTTGLISFNNSSFQAKAMSDVQREIYLAGNLFEYGKLKP